MKTNESYEFCSSGKVAYSSFEQAKRAGIYCRKEDGGRRLRAYYCPECGKYHLTSHYSKDNHEIYKNGHKYNRLETNREWEIIRGSIDITAIRKETSTKTLIIKSSIFVTE